jgi:tripeptide aminopeptidase
MLEKIEEVKFVVTIAEEAMKKANITPKTLPIRGGTDGAKLSFRGLPCPNIFTGGHNFHGKYEYIVLESMKKAVDVIVNIVKLYANSENF